MISSSIIILFDIIILFMSILALVLNDESGLLITILGSIMSLILMLPSQTTEIILIDFSVIVTGISLVITLIMIIGLFRR